MKKLLVLAVAIVMLASCSSSKNEDDGCVVCTFEGEYFDKLVDYPQYGGLQLYGNPYSWEDKLTGLSGAVNFAWGEYAFYNGGIAISSYFDPNPTSTTATYEQQLAVFAQKAHSGNNCAVVNGSNCSYADTRAVLNLSQPGVIKYLWICPTVYSYYTAVNGNEFTQALKPGEKLTVIAEGLDADGRKTNETSYVMFVGGGKKTTDWTKWDLSGLGEVAKVLFSVKDGNDDILQPSYFAIDDIAVML